MKSKMKMRIASLAALLALSIAWPANAAQRPPDLWAPSGSRLRHTDGETDAGEVCTRGDSLDRNAEARGTGAEGSEHSSNHSVHRSGGG